MLLYRRRARCRIDLTADDALAFIKYDRRRIDVMCARPSSRLGISVVQ